MAALTLAIIGAAAAAAAAGVSVHNTQEAKRQQVDAGRDQENALLAEQGKVDAQNYQNSAEQEAVMARARQKALASSTGGSTYGGTLRTSPLGVPSAPVVSNKSLFGL